MAIWMWAVSSLVFAAFALYKHIPQMEFLIREFNKFRETEKNPPNLNALYEIIDFSKQYYQFSSELEKHVNNIKDDFLKDSLQTFLSGAVRGHELLRALRIRADERYDASVAMINELRGISKFLPAVGWAVALSATLWLYGTGPISENYIERAGIGLSFVMISIFYGLTVMYYMIDPTVSRIEKLAYAVRAKDILVIDAISHLTRKNSAYEMFEAVNLNLPQEKKLHLWEFFPQDDAKVS